MADLTIEELGMLEALGIETVIIMIAEIRRHRAAKGADADHVLETVFDTCEDVLRGAGVYGYSRTISTRVADQLATPAIRLDVADVRLIDRALGALTSDYNDVPHDHIDRIRRMLTAHGAKP